jgi:hypothetical protein
VGFVVIKALGHIGSDIRILSFGDGLAACFLIFWPQSLENHLASVVSWKWT